LDPVSVTLGISSVQSDPVVIKEFVIQDPDFGYEFGEEPGDVIKGICVK
jgi:hypothetical protein